MNDAAKIAAVIRRFADSTSSRGIWQHERKLAEQLGGRAIDVNTAAAARRIGESLRTQTGRAD